MVIWVCKEQTWESCTGSLGPFDNLKEKIKRQKLALRNPRVRIAKYDFKPYSEEEETFNHTVPNYNDTLHDYASNRPA